MGVALVRGRVTAEFPGAPPYPTGRMESSGKMERSDRRDLPWGRLALGITAIFLALLVERAVRHEPRPNAERAELLHPRGAVDSLAPIEWTGELPSERYRFLAVVRDPDVNGDEGELARSPFLEVNEWDMAGVDRSGWGKVQIRVYAVDPRDAEEDLRKDSPLRTEKVIAWE